LVALSAKNTPVYFEHDKEKGTWNEAGVKLSPIDEDDEDGERALYWGCNITCAEKGACQFDYKLNETLGKFWVKPVDKEHKIDGKKNPEVDHEIVEDSTSSESSSESDSNSSSLGSSSTESDVDSSESGIEDSSSSQSEEENGDNAPRTNVYHVPKRDETTTEILHQLHPQSSLPLDDRKNNTRTAIILLVGFIATFAVFFSLMCLLVTYFTRNGGPRQGDILGMRFAPNDDQSGQDIPLAIVRPKKTHHDTP